MLQDELDSYQEAISQIWSWQKSFVLTHFDSYQDRRKVWKSGGCGSNVVGLICPSVVNLRGKRFKLHNYVRYRNTHQRSMEVQFGRYQKYILQEWSIVKNLSCVSCAPLNVFPVNSLPSDRANWSVKIWGCHCTIGSNSPA